MDLALRCAIIDDSEVFLFAAQRMLGSHGIDVVCAVTNGTEGLARVRELRPDVVLVDLFLGDECGLALANQIAGCADHNPVVILISSHCADDLDLLINAHTITGCLPKHKLTGQAIREIVGRAKAEGFLE